MGTPHAILMTATAMAIGAAFAADSGAGSSQDSHAAARKLIAESKCEACHARKVGGDGTGIYTRPDRKVKTKARVAGQVALCNTELNLGLFPDDEAAITAFLNDTYYKYK